MSSSHGESTQDAAVGIPEALMIGTAKANFDKPIDYSTVADKVAIIVGGASGIGLAIATELVRHGALVAILDINEANGATATRELLEIRERSAKFIRTDVVSWDSQKSAFKEVLSWARNRIDIVVFSAGLRPNNIREYLNPSNLGTEPSAPPTTTLDVNVTGAYFTAHLATWYFTVIAREQQQSALIVPPDSAIDVIIPPFRPQLLLLGSLASYYDQHGCPDYGASKHGIRGIWGALRHDTADFANMQVNLLAPGYTETPLMEPAVFASLRDNGIWVADTTDVVAGAMRCLFDPEVEARAICIARNFDGVPGSGNFDLSDDPNEFCGGREVLEHYRAGSFHRVAGHRENNS
ncbi:NAD(P)-binding protein [Dissoconium aciculare CBS 342.82]|uniref:NAD(P)-binding protein n=1 Tax=Dissoconium aciculare CBS 342.82 TaxID=1314786 RepID=A0A6J3M1X9_9PEZI|nr:NAD(P)-binding protein [Dissoconium aciculare CBS 342.82]KAF1821908.1 NAD(P)-binding protein [Dissoconium aciculare CBS 342.82]